MIPSFAIVRVSPTSATVAPPRRSASQPSWSISAGAQAISVVASWGTTRRSPSIAYRPPIVLHPALAEICDVLEREVHLRARHERAADDIDG